MLLLKLTSRFCAISRHTKLNSLQVTSKFRTCAHHRALQPNLESALDRVDHHEFGTLRTIYQNPYIVSLKTIFNLKYTLIPTYAVLILSEIGLYCYDQITVTDVASSFLVMFLVTVKILLLNKLCANTIGFMYLTEDDNVVISYVNFKGQRVDEKFNPNELKLTYIDERKFHAKLNRVFVTLNCQQSNRKFNLHLKNAKIYEEALIHYFGTLPLTAF